MTSSRVRKSISWFSFCEAIVCLFILFAGALRRLSHSKRATQNDFVVSHDDVHRAFQPEVFFHGFVEDQRLAVSGFDKFLGHGLLRDYDVMTIL